MEVRVTKCWYPCFILPPFFPPLPSIFHIFELCHFFVIFLQLQMHTIQTLTTCTCVLIFCSCSCCCWLDCEYKEKKKRIHTIGKYNKINFPCADSNRCDHIVSEWRNIFNSRLLAVILNNKLVLWTIFRCVATECAYTLIVRTL